MTPDQRAKADELRRVTTRLAQLRARHEALMVELHDDGMGLRTIAEHAGVSHMSVSKVVRGRAR